MWPQPLEALYGDEAEGGDIGSEPAGASLPMETLGEGTAGAVTFPVVP